MKSFLKKFRVDKHQKYLLYIWLAGIGINLANWLFIALNISPADRPIPLHYNIYFCIDLIGVWYNMFVIPLSGLVIIIVNSWLLKSLKGNKFYKYLLLGISSFCQVLLLLASIFIILETR